MTVFEFVVYQLNTTIDMIYLGADNSSIHCRERLAIELDNCIICLEAIFKKCAVNKVTFSPLFTSVP